MTTNRKLTNEIVDQRLEQRPITRIGEIKNATTKTEWHCIVCGNQWFAVPNSVLRGSGCPDCYGNNRLTNKNIDDKIKSQPLKRVGNYQGFDIPILWECQLCEHQWKASPNNVIKKHSGCPKCSVIKRGTKKSNTAKQRSAQILADKNIVLLDHYTRVVDKHNVQCQTCNHQWYVRLNDIVNNDHGCPSCAGLLPLSNSVIDQRLREMDRDVTRVSNVVNATSKIEWKCSYGHSWRAVPDAVLNGRHGCPVCNNKGLYNKQYLVKNPEMCGYPAVLYFVRFINKTTNQHFLKIGITKSSVTLRFNRYKSEYIWEELFSHVLPLATCISIEQSLLEEFKEHQTFPFDKFDGRTECFKDTPEIEAMLLEQINLYVVDGQT